MESKRPKYLHRMANGVCKQTTEYLRLSFIYLSKSVLFSNRERYSPTTIKYYEKENEQV